MDFFETVYKRQTIRKYKNALPPSNDIIKIIDAARLAPSATNSQNWEFIVVTNLQIKEEMRKCVKEKYEELKSLASNDEEKQIIERYKNFSTFFADAPVVVAIIEKPKSSPAAALFKDSGITSEEFNLMRPDSSLLSIGAAIENMTLASVALGYSNCWLAAPIVAYKELKRILNVKDEDKIVSLLTIGIANNQPSRPFKKPLEEVCRFID